jgi:hypothetical protein
MQVANVRWSDGSIGSIGRQALLRSDNNFTDGEIFVWHGNGEKSYCYIRTRILTFCKPKLESSYLERTTKR